MKKAILLFGLLSGIFTFGQVKKTEITKDELEFIAYDKHSLLEGIAPKDLKRIVELNNTLFITEHSYNGEILFREAIKKWSPMYVSLNSSNRTNNHICINYNKIPSDLVLELLENNWESIKSDSDKYICIKDFQVIDVSKYGVKINNLYKNLITTKIYKLEF